MVQVSHAVFFRCDGNEKIGFGHLSRCVKLARVLENLGVHATFIIESPSIPHLERLANHQKYLSIGTPVSEADDADATVRLLAQQISPKFLLLDSYTLSRDWEQALIESGIYLVVLDDSLEEHAANLVVNYRPGLRQEDCPRDGEQRWLTGSQYFPISQKHTPRKYRKEKALFFCGGTSGYSRQNTFFATAIKSFASARVAMDIIVTNDKSRNFIRQLIDQNSSPENSTINIVDHIRNLDQEIYSYTWIVGPASTTLYEGILAGCIAISCSLQTESLPQSDSWTHVGHLLHLGHCSEGDANQIANMIDLAIHEKNNLIKLRNLAPDPMDASATTEAYSKLLSYIQKKDVYPQNNGPSYHPITESIRKAELPDIWAWLNARNQTAMREISSSKDEITRKNHVKWWLDTDKRKYVLEKNRIPIAYFWHQRLNDSDGDFFIGGWFPAAEQTMSLKDSLEIMQFQFEYARQEGWINATWLASIEPKNKISLALSERFGFTTANAMNRRRLQRLFLGAGPATKMLQLRFEHVT